MLERAGNGDHGREQQVYAGMVKPAELAHDLAIYRMYQAEAKKIMGEGGTIRRIVLDYELKKRVYAPLARARDLPREEYRRRQAEVARENGLKVTGGRILLPDLRIEYETRGGEPARVDLELATEHYKEGQMRAKAAAGFKFYMAGSARGRGSAYFDDRGIAAEILSI